jgi:hypothetical protein
LQKLTRGRPELRTLRESLEEVYRLFDRRCRTQTALKKLQKLSRRVRLFKKLGKSLDKLKSPNLGKALEFLDDKLLGATSNATQRRGPTAAFAKPRRASTAPDPHREQRATNRAGCLKTLHHARYDPESAHP